MRLPHLTTRALVLLAISVSLGIAGLWSDAGGDVWRVLVAAVVLLLVLEHYALQSTAVQFERQVPERAHLGRRTDYGLAARNTGTAPLTLRILLTPPVGMRGEARVREATLAPGDAVSFSNTATMARLGDTAWDAIPMRLRGRFGLAWWERHAQLPAHTDVVPDTLGAAAERVGGERGGERSVRSRGHGLELHGLREYQPGDSLRMVDWKATARRGRACVRLFEDDQHVEVLVLLDCSRRSALQAGALDRLGHAVNVIARLAETAAGHGDPVGVLTYAEDVIEQLRPAAGATALRRVRDALHRARPRDSEPSLLRAAVAARRLLARRSLVVILAEPALADDGGQLLRALAHLAPPHLPLIAAMTDADIEQRALARATHWRDPYDILAAREIRQATHARHVRARRLGAEIVAATPAAIEAALIGRYQLLRQRRRV